MVKKYCVHVLIVTSLIISSWGFSANTKAQSPEFKFEHISIAQGLSQGTVFCILQDSKGFMWFGTQNGLNRYDGNTFKVYDYDPRNPNSLSYNMVLSIYEDKSGMIWVGTWGGGLNKFDPKTEKFTVYKSDPQKPDSLSDNNINAIYEDRSGSLWIGTHNGLNKFDQRNGKCIHYLVENNPSDDTQPNRILSIFQDSENNLWVGAEKGLYKSSPDKKDFIPCLVKIKKVEAIAEDGYGILWVGTGSGLNKVDRGKSVEIPFPDESVVSKKMGDKLIRVIYIDQTGLLWIGTQTDGLYRVDPGKNVVNHFSSDPDKPDSLSHNDVRAICKDRTGLMWIGTFDGGANKFDPERKNFTLYGNDPGNSISFKNKKVWSIVESKNGGVWIGTRGDGIYPFDPVIKKFSKPLIPGSDSNDNPQQRKFIRAMCAEKESDTLWVGTERGGLYRFDIKTKIFSPFNKLNTDAYILSIYEDRSGVLWVGTKDGGLIRIDKDRKNIKTYKNDPRRNDSLSSNEVYAIDEDKQGILWVGTGNGGLNRFDKKNESFRRYLPSKTDLDSISHNFLLTIYEDTKGILWIGTDGGGLNKLIDREKGTFKAYRTTAGLPDNVIYAILEDEENNLWLSTNRGLSRFNPGTETFRNYTVRDGLQDYEFNRGAACKRKLKNSEELYFGGVKGFNVFKPSDFKTDSPAPTVVITSLKKFNQGNRVDISISETGPLHLSYKDYSISFEFAALDFSDPENNRYAYRLEPGSQEWINLGNKHEQTFPSLEPDKYTFRVKGANNEGVWNDEGASVTIIVSPPFTATLLFRIPLLLVIGGVIFGFVLWRISDIKKKGKAIKVAYDALQESEERYRTLVETSPDAITLCNIKGKIIMANPQTAFLLGYHNLDEMKPHVRTIFHGITLKDRALARKNAENVVKNGIATTMEFTLRAKDGTEIAAEISTSLIKQSEGVPPYFLAITRDITKRKEAEKKEKLIQEAEKMVSLGTLVSGVAHELNNPAGFIMLNADNFSLAWIDIVPILEQYYRTNKNFLIAGMPYQKSKDRIDELIKGLIDGAKRIKSIIKDLSDYSRPEDPLRREAVDINKVINSSLSLTNNTIKKATNMFSFEPGENLPVVWGNFQRLEQVFINLIQNACQALPDTSKSIFISTGYDKNNNRIAVTVKDEGVGIDEKNLAQITDPFFTTKRSAGGIGLGLSISHRILQEHRGTMEFASEVKKGTTVSVFLPIIEQR